jgi:nucleoside recognition membrane protein YjiH
MTDDQASRNSGDPGKVPAWGYLALVFAMLFFSGLFAGMDVWKAMDFNVVNGNFGNMKDAAKATFMGQGGAGARDGFLFAIGLIPAVMLALGVVEVADHLGALRAAQKMLSPLLRPLMGIPGIAGLALISSMQSTDAGAGMTKALRDSGVLTEKERTIFAAFQFSAGGTITNFFSSGAALFGFLAVPTIAPLMVMIVMKVVGANVMRFTINAVAKDIEVDDAP